MDRLWYRGPLALYDRAYRWAHGLDQSAAQIGPIIRLGRERLRRPVQLADGTVMAAGQIIGVVHLDNAVAAALHADGLGPQAVGFAFRRELIESLRILADLTVPGHRLAHLPAFCAVTIFVGLRRLGFERVPGPAFPRIVGAYQRALQAWLHPAGRLRAGAADRHAAQRLMISRRELQARYGVAARMRATAVSGSLRPPSGRP